MNVSKGDSTYKIAPIASSITDTTLGELSVTKDVNAVLREIEHWHQGTISAFAIMYRGEHKVWHGFRWDGQRASFIVTTLTSGPMMEHDGGCVLEFRQVITGETVA